MSTAANVEQYLRLNGFKQTGNSWRGNTPQKPGSDSHACVVTIEGPEHGPYINFSTGESGSVRSSATSTERANDRASSTAVAAMSRRSSRTSSRCSLPSEVRAMPIISSIR